MTTRERILGSALGLALAGTVTYFGVRKMLIDHSAELDATRIRLTDELAKLNRENEQVASAAKSITGWAALTYDTDELRASTKLGATLRALVERAGLSGESFSMQPVRGTRVRGIYREIGRTIRARGKMQQVVDFLYLLSKEPHLHRLDNVIITPQPKTNETDLQVRYMALMLDAKEDLKTDLLPTTAPTDLDSEDRQLYNCIASRDLFRPYIQRRQPPPPQVATPGPPRPVPPRPTPAAPRPTPTPEPNAGRLKIVGLPDWRGKPEVLVSDTSRGELRTYEMGDALGGGTIVMVDYRALPSPVNPEILSPSRVILKVDPDFWAVELGQTLTQKRRLSSDQLPDSIRRASDEAPGNKVKENAPAER
ncbi:MAG TPA: hypothetical protein VM695_01345 [Phycisphaerae bacterium]|nr:hypothetical protein [Phycisphaerae bacterium]